MQMIKSCSFSIYIITLNLILKDRLVPLVKKFQVRRKITLN
jgi:hypothetical protein